MLTHAGLQAVVVATVTTVHAEQAIKGELATDITRYFTNLRFCVTTIEMGQSAQCNDGFEIRRLTCD